MILVCFSVVDHSSFANVTTKWVPEVRHHNPTAVVALVGTKIDLRTDAKTVAQLREMNLHPITEKEGSAMAKAVGACAYIEGSALTQEGFKRSFDTLVNTAFLQSVNRLQQTAEREQAPSSSRWLTLSSCNIM